MSDGRVLRVTVTGSESTAKSWLAERLARHFEAPWAREFAREYALQKGAPLDASDVEPIARGQIQSEDEVLRTARTLAILDTDLVSTVVYAKHYYGACPPWVERSARDRLADLYLLCDIDVQWVADAARDRPEARHAVHAAFEEHLQRYGAPYLLVRGTPAQRDAISVAAIEDLLASVPRHR